MKCTNEFINLHELSEETIQYYEMVQLVAFVHYSHFTNWSFEIAIEQWAERGYAVPELTRLHWIQQNMKLYPATARGDMTGHRTWNSRRDQTCQLDDFENALFMNLQRVFVSPENMVATLDDETYGCRAKDNQVKALNDRKADTEGYSADVLADCLFRAPIALRLRRRGVGQDENIRVLLSNAFRTGGTESAGSSLLGADRGYACVPTAELIALKGYGCILIHPNHLLNNHPFCSLSAYDGTGFNQVPEFEDDGMKKKDEHASKFLVDDSPNLGFHAMTSTRRIPNTTKTITAVALRERGDSKQSKILRFSYTELKGSLGEETQLHSYVGIRHTYGRRPTFRRSHLFTADAEEKLAGSPDVSLGSIDSKISGAELRTLKDDANDNVVHHGDEEIGITDPARRISLSPAPPGNGNHQPTGSHESDGDDDIDKAEQKDDDDIDEEEQKDDDGDAEVEEERSREGSSSHTSSDEEGASKKDVNQQGDDADDGRAPLSYRR